MVIECALWRSNAYHTEILENYFYEMTHVFDDAYKNNDKHQSLSQLFRDRSIILVRQSFPWSANFNCIGVGVVVNSNGLHKQDEFQEIRMLRYMFGKLISDRIGWNESKCKSSVSWQYQGYWRWWYRHMQWILWEKDCKERDLDTHMVLELREKVKKRTWKVFLCKVF